MFVCLFGLFHCSLLAYSYLRLGNGWWSRSLRQVAWGAGGCVRSMLPHKSRSRTMRLSIARARSH